MRCGPAPAVPSPPAARVAVPGEGNPVTDVLLVGEGPGQREDATGRPFVGPAGQLLDEMLRSIGWQRGDVFITNVVKCRPPGNRDPEPDGDGCLRAVSRSPGGGAGPGLVVTLGRHSLQRYLPGARICGGARPPAPIGRSLRVPDVPSRCRAAVQRPAGDAGGGHARPAGRAAGRPPGDEAEREEAGQAAPAGAVTSPTPTVEDDEPNR